MHKKEEQWERLEGEKETTIKQVFEVKMMKLIRGLLAQLWSIKTNFTTGRLTYEIHSQPQHF